MIASMGDHDRDAILARRALLISATLAGLACTTPKDPGDTNSKDPGEPVSATSEQPPPVVVEDPGVRPEQPKPADGSRPSWSEVMAKAPPLEVPTGLTTNENQLLEGLAQYGRARYERLAQAWAALPSCGPSDPNCPEWEQALELIEELTGDDYGPLCGYSPEVTHTYLSRERATDRYIRELTEVLLADLDAAVVARGNPADSEAWTTRRSRDTMYGQPCLSCAMPTAEPVTDAIPFPDNAATLDTSADVVLQRAKSTHDYNRQSVKAKLIIRGHADPGEDDPDAIALQRAEAVAGALVGLGVNRKHIEVRSYGAALPLTKDAEHADLNRRVDFEVLEP